MATTWLLLSFLSTLLITTHASPSQKCNPNDKRALLQIKKELNNPPLLSSWKPNTDCCRVGSWNGVNCIDGRVFSLTINNTAAVAANLPPSIGDLPYIQDLTFYNLPNLKGPIPKSIAKLAQLKYLTISMTGISGPIPDFMAQLSSIVNLDLTHNSLTGTLPPSLYRLPNLSGLLLYNNQLTGPIPSSYGYFNSTNLPNLLFSQNKLSGKLPLTLAKLNSSLIDLSHNRLEGDASMLFGSEKALSYIDLSWNEFEFDLGKIEMPESLSTVDVSHNRVYGGFPAGMENVLVLNVSYNRMCGEIPKVGKMQSFDVSSYFHNKCLCGSPLPSCK